VTALAAERRRRGLSALAAARHAGLSDATVNAWENGRNQPRLPELARYAAALGYTLTLAPTREVTRGTA